MTCWLARRRRPARNLWWCHLTGSNVDVAASNSEKKRIILNVLSFKGLYGCDWRCFLSTRWQHVLCGRAGIFSAFTEERSSIVAFLFLSFFKTTFFMKFEAVASQTLGRDACVSVFRLSRPTGDHASLKKWCWDCRIQSCRTSLFEPCWRMI